ncbi:hypothetical protein Poly24_31320 [Rosistilla carotiformis]|uniref:Secreted protein n=1 Tax=Rosistilla carotiformis TaxID=2528017 RepID=A0A518JV65_9BACT|nr:hypothetical protein [Rosistilla carotiformis]QDV69416.1 hypothetical protein Poly24_31320 [Rosistilla carotiformis]
MKIASWFLVLSLFAVCGCNDAPSGSVGDANDPALTTDLEPIDEAAEAAANSGH